MSYSQASRGNVTMIDDLPELNDIEPGYGNRPIQHGNMQGPPQHIQEGILSPEMAQKLQRHVRYRHVPTQEAGMSAYGPPVEQYEQIEPPQQQPPMPSGPVVSCLDINGHVTTCPICSRFYNNDKTVYIIVIVVLTIICLLLLKKVLDV